MNKTPYREYLDKRKFWDQFSDDYTFRLEQNGIAYDELIIASLKCDHHFFGNKRNSRCCFCNIRKDTFRIYKNEIKYIKAMENLTVLEIWHAHQKWMKYWSAIGLETAILAEADQKAKSEFAVGKIRCRHKFESHRCILCGGLEADYNKHVNHINTVLHEAFIKYPLV